MSDIKKIQKNATPLDAGQRLDIWLGQIPEIETRNQASKLIEKNKVKVSGVMQLKVKGSYRLRGDETVEIEIPPPQQSSITPQDIPIEFLFQDNDIAVINKPAGLVTHPAAGHQDGTLVNALMYHVKDLSDIGGVERPGLVHRLDKDTSGVLVVAKNNKAHVRLSEDFKKHHIERIYWAIVAGIPKEKEKTITTYLARHPVHRKAFSSQERGKEATTHYKVLKAYKNQASLLEVKLETGRTHQIRVHLSEMGHPVLGDQLYGIKRQKHLITHPLLKKTLSNISRHALHAAVLGFEHPRTGQHLTYETQWPDDLKELIDALSSL